jgi:hypothetical protein
MPLTDAAVRQVKPTGKNTPSKTPLAVHCSSVPRAPSCGTFVSTNWGKQARISIGVYPAVSLKEAREARDQARALVAQGVDPRANRREARLAACSASESAFRAVYDDWYVFRVLSLKRGRPSTLVQIERHFTKDILPWLGDLPIVEVSRQHVLEVLRKIERRKVMTTAEKCRTWLNQLFRPAGQQPFHALPLSNAVLYCEILNNLESLCCFNVIEATSRGWIYNVSFGLGRFQVRFYSPLES